MNKSEYFELVKSYKLLANKSLGQNFLIDSDKAESIVAKLDINEGDNVLEIGAGLGSLSYFLTKSKAHVTLIDVDDNMINFLSEHLENGTNIFIKRQNIFKEDILNYSKIVGNLPYYITSGIIEYILLNAKNVKLIVLMVQKEVYSRLIDKKEVTPLTLLMNHVASISSCVNVGRNSFAPIPHVDSAYFALTPNENIKNKDNISLYKLMSKIFLYRRKTVLNCLTSLIGNKEEAAKLLAECSTSLSARPEQLDIKFYLKLLNLLKSSNFISTIM